LREAFGAAFQLWPADDRPMPATSEPPAGDGRDTVPLELGLMAEFAAASADQAVEYLEPDRWLVMLKVPESTDLELIATGVVRSRDPDLLSRMATQCRQQMSWRRAAEVANRQRETKERDRQGAVEDLLFLQQTAGHLTLSEMSLDIVALAREVFPKLRARLHAEAVVLVSAGRDKSACLVGPPVVSAGRNRLEDRACTQLVERFRTAALSQPVVGNHCQQSPELRAIDGLGSFLLVPMLRSRSVIGWLLALNRQASPRGRATGGASKAGRHEFTPSEASLLQSTAAILATHATNVDLFRDKEQLFLDMVRALVNAIEAKDHYTSGHSERVGLFASHIAAAYGLPAAVCKRIYLAGLLHDVGKIAVRDDVLSNPTSLSVEESEEIKRHPDEGWGILYGPEALDDVLVGVLHHHERWDGRGYPDGLKEDAIPLDARILAVADTFDAMTSDRSYRKALPQQRAEEILRNGAGSQWDPQVIAVALRLMPDLQAMRLRHVVRKPVSRRGYRTLRNIDLNQAVVTPTPLEAR
jgi:HD-GYP domain-containing protein (c-di-GMP phosphodiesterase class II)